jgi:DNA-binding NarL/FixJ family response regulator
MPAGRAAAGLTAALASGLLSQDDRQLVSFRHALAARAVHETIPGSERRLLHLAAAHVLEELSPRPVAELARHFREAGEIAKWRRYGEETAERAIAAGDEATAAAVLCDLIAHAGLPGRGAARLLDNLAFATMASPVRYAQDLVSALRGAMSAGTMTAGEEGVVRFQIGRIMQMTENYEGARAEVQRAIPFLADDPVTAARAMTMLGWAHDTGSPARVYTRWLRRAAPLAESLEPRDRLRIQVDRMTALLMLGEEEGWAEAARIPADGPDASQRRNVAIGQLNAGDLAIMWGRYDEARQRLGIALDMAEAHQYARYRALILANLTHLDWASGKWAGLAGRARPLADGRDGAPVRLEAVLVTGLLEAVAGHGAAAEDRFQLVLREWKRRGETAYVMRPATELAWLALRGGRVADALQVTDEPMAVVAGKGIWLWAAELGPARVAALTAAGRLAEASGLIAAFGRGLRGRDIPSARAGLALCRALLTEASGEHLRAAGLFGRAAGAYLAMPRPYDALHARERQAACLLAAGRTDASRVLAREVAQQFTALGARADAQRVSQALCPDGDAGRRPSPGRPGYGDQLSPRELDVARLLVSGGTNAVIAEQLFLSPKTVARHLESAMRKLGVSTRTAVAVRAVETGIVSPSSPDAADSASS